MSAEKRLKIPRPLLFLILFEIAIPLAAFCVDGWDPYRGYAGGSNLFESFLNLMFGIHLLISGPAIIFILVFGVLLLAILGPSPSPPPSSGGPTDFYFWGITMCLLTIGEWMLIYQCFKGEDISWRWSVASRNGKIEGCLWMFGFGAIWLVTGCLQVVVWLLVGFAA